jgi:hypothetical protein
MLVLWPDFGEEVVPDEEVEVHGRADRLCPVTDRDFRTGFSTPMISFLDIGFLKEYHRPSRGRVRDPVIPLDFKSSMGL